MPCFFLLELLFFLIKIKILKKNLSFEKAGIKVYFFACNIVILWFDWGFRNEVKMVSNKPWLELLIMMMICL